MRVTLDGPDGWARGWIADWHHTPVQLKHQQGEGGMVLLTVTGWTISSWRWIENDHQKLPLVSGGHLHQGMVPEKTSIIDKVHDTDARQCSIPCIQVHQWLTSQQRVQRWQNDDIAPFLTWFEPNWTACGHQIGHDHIKKTDMIHGYETYKC